MAWRLPSTTGTTRSAIDNRSSGSLSPSQWYVTLSLSSSLPPSPSLPPSAIDYRNGTISHRQQELRKSVSLSVVRHSLSLFLPASLPPSLPLPSTTGTHDQPYRQQELRKSVSISVVRHTLSLFLTPSFPPSLPPSLPR